jgi:hypothetical protein
MMGFRFSVKAGPIRYSAPIGGGRKSAHGARPDRTQNRLSDAAQARQLREAAAELDQARQNLGEARAKSQSDAAFPEPAPYVYCRVTAVHEDSLDLVSDEGEAWEGISCDPADTAKIEVGGRFTWDGQTLGNYVPQSVQGEIIAQIQRLNAMPATDRIQMRDAHTVQTMREFGYVFTADNKVVSAEPGQSLPPDS